MAGLPHHLPCPPQKAPGQQGICLSSSHPWPVSSPLLIQTASKGPQRAESKGRDGKGMEAYPQRVAAGSARRMGNGKGCLKRSCASRPASLTAASVSAHHGNAYTARRERIAVPGPLEPIQRPLAPFGFGRGAQPQGWDPIQLNPAGENPPASPWLLLGFCLSRRTSKCRIIRYRQVRS